MAAKLKNFDLTVDEIKVMRAIKDLSKALDNLALSGQDTARAGYLMKQIGLLERQLEELRERSLIR